ncbi:MAG: S41 family peptidase [Chloroflexi bacterium]|nr:S41 family peptidase [Chloroflexota bacterium]
MSERRVPLALSLAIGLVLALVFVAGFAAGAVVQQSRAAGPAETSDSSLNTFLYAYHLVTQHSYYRPFDRKHLIDAAIDGMLSATGDPQTTFLSPQENKVANTELNGSRFSGIGAIVLPDRGALQVVVPIPKSPAAGAGLRPGDRIIRIDGRTISAMTGDAAIAKIHGPSGTTVRLTIVRGHRPAFTISVRRASMPPITAYGLPLPHHLGYIEVRSFGDTTSQEVSDAVGLLTAQHVRGIVLDLRDNPGGYVDAAQRVASEFLSHGVVAYEQGTDRKLQPLSVLPHQVKTSLPLVVLVNGGTASAAEITAAALHDNHRAIVMGTQTYGKGSMQSVYALSDGSSIRITDRLWLTPNKRSIQKVGIRPDVVTLEAGQGQTGTDPQLVAAERYLVKHTGS